MNRYSIFFTAPRQVEVREETLPNLAPDQVVVQTRLSALSPGTETLVYRGQFPEEMALDESIAALSGQFRYPFRNGYCAAGQVVEAGALVDPAWQNRLVFAFQPHASHFLAAPGELIPLPEDVSLEEAVFLPNMETAVNLVMDGKPVIGERVAVFGQGIVGLLTAALLAQFPLEQLVTLDRYPLRRQASRQLGAHASLDPLDPETAPKMQSLLEGGADLTYELSGAPEALDGAIAATGFEGRVVVGSWYGRKRASLDLGGRFHRSRVRLISSQVSTIASTYSGRWTKARRFEVAWEMLRSVRPSRFITHRFPLSEAAQAYQLVDQHPQDALQVVFTYP